MLYNGTTYYYATSIQGDVIAILNNAGTAVVQYAYDAWGNPISTTGAMATTLGTTNPLRYRGYVYDQEYGLYYLQSRYYDPEIGRFLNGDALASTGQGILGNNMFVYCNNNPILFLDPEGLCFEVGALLTWIDCGKIDCKTSKSYVEGDFSEELAVLRQETDTYKGVNVHMIMPGDAGFSFGDIYMPANASDSYADVLQLRHEYGHTIQLNNLGTVGYTVAVVLPSVTCFAIDELGIVDLSYYSLPWEFEADRFGNVPSRYYNRDYFNFYMFYTGLVSHATNNKMNYPVSVCA